MLYAVPNGTETFTERFNRLTSHLETHELIGILRVDAKIVARLKGGTQKMLKLDQGLRLARHLGISPYDLMGERDPSYSPLVTPPASAPIVTEAEPLAQAVGSEVATGLETLTAEVREMRARLDVLEQERAPARRRAS